MTLGNFVFSISTFKMRQLKKIHPKIVFQNDKNGDFEA